MFLETADPTLVFNAAPMVTREIEIRELQPYGLTAEDVTVTMGLKQGKLYDPKARMEYVKDILKQYHRLMRGGRDFQGKYRPYMIEQMQTIATWREA